MSFRIFLGVYFAFISLTFATSKKEVSVRYCSSHLAQQSLPMDDLLYKLLVPARGRTNAPNSKIAAKILPRLSKYPGWISPAIAKKWINEFRVTEDEFLMAFAEAAKSLARPPISNYYVGQAARAGSGRVYWSVNVEFIDFPLNHTIHGEQFMVALLKLHGEKHLETLALLGPPCGHCRQFLRELKHWKKARVLMPNHSPYYIEELLPVSFGPDNLGMREALLDSSHWRLIGNPRSKAESEAVRIASLSYAPYSRNPSGVVLRDKKNKLYLGMNIENVAFNPSLSALSVAFVHLLSRQGKFEEIVEVVLAEEEAPKKSERTMLEAVVRKYCPSAKIKILNIKVK